jgi:hypothetical protein
MLCSTVPFLMLISEMRYRGEWGDICADSTVPATARRRKPLRGLTSCGEEGVSSTWGAPFLFNTRQTPLG